MLDDCGIETEFPDFTRALGNASRSMLDDCGIETAFARCSSAPLQAVAIDARWLWDRDSAMSGSRLGSSSRRDRCSMAVGSRPSTSAIPRASCATSRSMLDGCGIETS